MVLSLYSALLRGARRRPRGAAPRFAPSLHRLEARDVPAIVASFTPGSGLLSVFGDNLDNTITVGRDAAGKLLVNGGAVTITGGTPTVANTTLIQVFGQAGNDTIALNEANGALPPANLFGGAGNDVLTGGSGGDQLFGQAGNDTLLGKGGADFLFGGSEDDTLTGGAGDDQVYGEAGGDCMTWDAGDGSDLNEGGAGADTVVVNGGNGAEAFSVTANGTRVRVDRLTPAPFSLDVGTTENLAVNLNGGDDTFTAGNGLAALVKLTVDGGAGNDTITGGDGADVLRGGDGNDTVTGGRGNDAVFLGAGDDVFVWNPGDGSDTVEGQDGFDRMVFNGANIAEKFDLSANGSRVRFTRDIANIVMDLNGVEGIDLNALGGADLVTVNDLTGTGLAQLNLNLAAAGGAAGDGAADTVVVNGTNGADVVSVFGSGTSYSIVGLATMVSVANSEGANDALVVNARGGNDGLTATTVPAGVVKLTLDGGAGDDTILGSQGDDVLLGGDGGDFVFGDNGNDTALLGAGDDVFEWAPGEGSDTLEGQEGADRMMFFGANVGERIDIVANGGRTLFLRDVANVSMDLNGVEEIEFRALGGADAVTVGDLTGTDVTNIELDLRGPTGGGDGAADTVTINGTAGADAFGAAGDSGGVLVFGLRAAVSIFHQEAANDRLVLNGLAGDDVIDARSLEADGIQLTLNGGLGNDLLLGSEGNDLVTGGDGNDVTLMGAGDDTFVWNPGDDNDTVEGQDGFDALVFNGANVSEVVTISANGSRVLFTRNVATVATDLNGVEGINFNAAGGTDTITVGDLSGTDVTEVNLNLGPADGAADTVIVAGTGGDDVALISGDANGAAVVGLATTVNVVGAEAANDRLVINTLGGSDVVEASGLAVGAIQLIADGGAGDDVLIGGAGADTLFGGEGDDVLVGGPGLDVLDGGPGDDVEIQ